MIGLILKDSQMEAAREFFELFKTPWELYHEDGIYDVVVTTGGGESIPNARLVIIYGSEAKGFDSNEGLKGGSRQSGLVLKHEDSEIPIYGHVLPFSPSHRHPRILSKDGQKIVAVEIQKDDVTVIRAGYDLFEEISFLLIHGQPPRNAPIPTLELHISLLRDWILNSGVPLAEVLAAPASYSFFVCLTHDVDFVRIGDHRLDHTMWGFVYRALLGSPVDAFKGFTSWRKVLKNFKSLLLLPFIYLGLKKDFWLQFDNYLELEGEARSTFFIIPFKDRPGYNVESETSHRRAAKYDVTDIEDYLSRLINHGDEIGVHGIDTWHDEDLGRLEYRKISTLTGKNELGNRVHWLCFREDTPRKLEKAGFTYDSTFGYNEAIGFRGGTSRPFRPLGSKKILEIPLNIQDNALMRLNGRPVPKEGAIASCRKIFESAEKFGGVVTVLWHLRSLAPERFWDKDYVALLEECRRRRACFGTGRDICKWFLKRRSIRFERVRFEKKKVFLKLSCDGDDAEPPFVLRIHNQKRSRPGNSEGLKGAFLDIPFSGSFQNEIGIPEPAIEIQSLRS